MSGLSDEQLARALQAEEQIAAKSQGQAQFAAALDASVRKVLQCEDVLSQALALSLIPLEHITAEAQVALALNAELGLSGPQAALGQTELVVQGLLAWFKHSFFRWTNSPPCNFCGGPTSSIGMGVPTAEEAADLAGRVELHRCSTCETVMRFPRYTNAAKLLETRHGRCGEWAHCFLLCLRAASIEARHCQDWEDHVWCEFYSERFGRWVHVDPCEAAFDTPLLYEKGWGKKLSYVVAVGRHGAADVTRRYVLDYSATSSRRRRVPEPWLLQHLGVMCAHMRRGLEPGLLRQLQLRDMTEQMQLVALGQPGREEAGHLPGRQTGSEAWRAARGETGANVEPASSATAPVAPGTLYRRAGDSKLPQLSAAAGRVCGGACRASGENEGPQQTVQRLFDGSTTTKWLDFGGGGPSGSAWVEYRLLDAQQPVVVTHYDLVSVEDCPERDPADWTLECLPCSTNSSSSSSSSNSRHYRLGDGGRDGSSSSGSAGHASSNGTMGDSASSSGVGGQEAWHVLDRRSGEAFAGRNQLRSFHAASPIAARRWRLRISRAAGPAAANSLQLSCWNLYAVEPRAQQAAAEQADAVQQVQGAGKHDSEQVQQAMQQQQQGHEHPQAGQPGEQLQEDGSATQQHAEHLPATTPVKAEETAATTKAGASPSAASSSSITALLHQLKQQQATLPPNAVSLLKRIITNLHQHPEEAKYRQIRACKVAAVLEAPAATELLLATGFKPLLVPVGSASGAAAAEDATELVLVMDANEANAAAVACAAQGLADVVNGSSGMN